MNRIIKNASWIIGCRIAQSILSFVISMMAARYLGPSNYGLINYATSLVAFVTPVMTLGFSSILVQEFVAVPEADGEILGTALVSCAITSVLCGLGVVAFAFVSNPGDSVTVIVCALYSISLFFTAMEMSQYWFQAKLLSKYTSVISLCSFAIVSAYKLYLLATGKSVYWFAVSYALDYMLIAVATLIMYKKLGGGRLYFSLEKAKAMFAKGKHYILSGMMVTICAQTDKIMLKMMMGADATGYYSAAVICAGISSFVFAAIADSFRPVIFEAKKSDEGLYELNVKRLYSVFLYLSFVQCVVIALFAPLIIRLTYGVGYAPAIPALRVVVWFTTFSYLGIARNIWILAENKQRYLWFINMSGAIANVIMNWIMIPIWGIIGAAVASLLTQCFTNVIMGYILKPIRYNNKLMIESLHPRYMMGMIQRILHP